MLLIYASHSGNSIDKSWREKEGERAWNKMKDATFSVAL